MAAPPATLAPAPPGIDPALAYLYDENGVFYPEADGEPMPDATYQDRTIRSARFQLDHHFHRRTGTYVGGNTLIYYEQGNPRRVVSPDCYVALDVDFAIIHYRDCYRVWDMGKPPDFVMEVASKSTARNDTGEKMRIYAGMGIAEYWLFDQTPDGEYYGFRLAGYRLVNGNYEPFAVIEDSIGNLSGYSPTLGLDIRWEYDPVWDEGKIRFYHPMSGTYLLDYEESFLVIEESDAARQQAEAALQESETARSAAETALQQADAARRQAETDRSAAAAEAAALRAQLRQLQAQQNPEP